MHLSNEFIILMRFTAYMVSIASIAVLVSVAIERVTRDLG